MIRGTVNARLEAVLRLRVTGPTGIDMEVDAVVDTGFTGSLVLPTTAIGALGLTRRSGGSATLADGTVRHFDTYGAEVEWDGTKRGAVVSAVGTEALIGMMLLDGHELRVEVEVGGMVEVRPLRPWRAPWLLGD
jgi:clan AA aspartic protease